MVWLRIMKANTTMLPRICCQYFMACDVNSIAETEVESCSKGVFARLAMHGKGPCFLRCGISAVVSVGYVVSVFAFVNVGKFLE
jgi:hypothetical protein